MRSSSLLARMPFASALAIAAATVPLIAADPSGTWTVRTNFEWLPMLECSFQRAQKVTGSCRVGESSFELAGASEDGTKVFWAFEVPGSAPGGGTVRYSFAGEIDARATTIKGSVVGSDLGARFPDQAGNFTATKAQR